MVRLLAAACSLLGLLVLCSLMAGIVRSDRARSSVELVVAYDDLAPWASDSAAHFWRWYRTAGATALIVRERTLGDAADAGELTVVSGREIFDAFRVQGVISGYIWEQLRYRRLAAAHTYVITPQREQERLRERLQAAWDSAVTVPARQSWSADLRVIEVERPVAEVRAVGLGLPELPAELRAEQPRLIVLPARYTRADDWRGETGVIGQLRPGEGEVFAFHPHAGRLGITPPTLRRFPGNGSVTPVDIIRAAGVQRHRLLWFAQTDGKLYLHEPAVAADVLRSMRLQAAPVDWQQPEPEPLSAAGEWHLWLLPLVFLWPLLHLLRQTGLSADRALAAGVVLMALLAGVLWWGHKDAALYLLAPLLACLILPAAAVLVLPPLTADRYAGGRGVLLVFARTGGALLLVFAGGLAAYVPLALLAERARELTVLAAALPALPSLLRLALLLSLLLLAWLLQRRLLPGSGWRTPLTVAHLVLLCPAALLLYLAHSWPGAAPPSTGVIVAVYGGVLALMLFFLLSLIGRPRAALACGWLGGFGLAALLTLFLPAGLHSSLHAAYLSVTLTPALLLAAVALVAVVGALGLRAKWADIP